MPYFGAPISVAQMGDTSYDVGLIAFTIRGVNFNSANTDNAIPIKLPKGYTRYRVQQFAISHASQTLTTATFGVFTAAAGGGTAIVAAATAITISTATEGTVNNCNVGNAANNTVLSITDATLYFRVGTAQGAAATGDVTLIIQPLS